MANGTTAADVMNILNQGIQQRTAAKQAELQFSLSKMQMGFQETLNKQEKFKFAWKNIKKENTKNLDRFADNFIQEMSSIGDRATGITFRQIMSMEAGDKKVAQMTRYQKHLEESLTKHGGKELADVESQKIWAMLTENVLGDASPVHKARANEMAKDMSAYLLRERETTEDFNQEAVEAYDRDIFPSWAEERGLTGDKYNPDRAAYDVDSIDYQMMGNTPIIADKALRDQYMKDRTNFLKSKGKYYAPDTMNMYQRAGVLNNRGSLVNMESIKKAVENEGRLDKEIQGYLDGDFELAKDYLEYPTYQLEEPVIQFALNQAVDETVQAAKEGRNWDNTVLGIILASYAGQILDPAIRGEIARFSEGSQQYMDDLNRDLQKAGKGKSKGLSAKEFKLKYNTIKGPLWRGEQAALDQLKRQSWIHGIKQTKSIAKPKAAIDALKLMTQGKYAQGALKGAALGGWFAPTIYSMLGEKIGGEPGEAIGQTAGAAVMAKKVGIPSGVKVSRSFMSFLRNRLPANVAKKLGPAAAAALIEPTPFGEMLLAAAGVGVSIYEVAKIYKEWKDIGGD